ncbi:hypothetical protein FB451DRAFT_1495235, partial [Mycena latifolia]
AWPASHRPFPATSPSYLLLRRPPVPIPRVITPTRRPIHADAMPALSALRRRYARPHPITSALRPLSPHYVGITSALPAVAPPALQPHLGVARPVPPSHGADTMQRAGPAACNADTLPLQRRHAAPTYHAPSLPLLRPQLAPRRSRWCRPRRCARAPPSLPTPSLRCTVAATRNVTRPSRPSPNELATAIFAPILASLRYALPPLRAPTPFPPASPRLVLASPASLRDAPRVPARSHLPQSSLASPYTSHPSFLPVLPSARPTLNDMGSIVVTHGLDNAAWGCIFRMGQSLLANAVTILTDPPFQRKILLRQFIWYSGLGWGGVIGSCTSLPYSNYDLTYFYFSISTGIASVSPTAPGPQQWQYIFYIWGRDDASVVRHLVLPAGFPDVHFDSRRPFLTPHLCVLAVQRVAGNQLGIKNKKFKRQQVRVAGAFLAPPPSEVKDIKLWILFSSLFVAAILNGVVSKDMGFSTSKTTVLKSVSDITQIVALIVGGVITLNVKNSALVTWQSVGFAPGCADVFLSSSELLQSNPRPSTAARKTQALLAIFSPTITMNIGWPLLILPEEPYPPPPLKTIPRSPSNGCGAQVHGAVFMMRRNQCWFGWKDRLARTVVPLDAEYFPSAMAESLDLRNGG